MLSLPKKMIAPLFLGTVHKVQRRQQKEIHDQLTADPPSPL